VHFYRVGSNIAVVVQVQMQQLDILPGKYVNIYVVLYFAVAGVLYLMAEFALIKKQ